MRRFGGAAAAPLSFRRSINPSPCHICSISTSSISRRYVALAVVKKSPKRLKYSTPRFTKVLILSVCKIVKEIVSFRLPYFFAPSGGWIIVRWSWSVWLGLLEIGPDRWALEARSCWSYSYWYCVCQFPPLLFLFLTNVWELNKIMECLCWNQSLQDHS